MGKAFFSGWALWEKLVFCLACAIIVTLLLGCIKLTYTHWRLRKYTAVAEEQRKEQALQRQMSIRSRRTAEVPFGIRALESGIEVDGVWISRNNSPEPRSREPSSQSSWKQVPRSSSSTGSSNPEMQNKHDRSSTNSTTSTVRPPSHGYDQPQSMSRTSSRDSSPDAAISKPPRSRCPPPTYARYSVNPYVVRSSANMNMLQGLEASYRKSLHDRTDSEQDPGSSSSSRESTNSSDDAAPLYASAPTLLNAQPRPIDTDKDMDLLNKHRTSQVAETGQLTPRVKRPMQQGSEWANNAVIPPLSLSTETKVDNFGSPTQSASSSPTDQAVNTSSTPTAQPPSLRKLSMPDVTSFADFVKTAPRPESMASSPQSYSSFINGGGLRSTGAMSTASPSAPGVSGNDLIALTHPALRDLEAHQRRPSRSQVEPPKRGSFEKQESIVMRGHGSGFEILKPGSLDVKPSPLDLQRANPPISLHNAFGSRPRSSSQESRQSRKLQKTRRPSKSSSSSRSRSRSIGGRSIS